jgi:alkylated DNA repair protein alkB family protein 8
MWSHGITPRKYDVIDAPPGGLTTLRREKRTSLTFRKIRTSECDCPYTTWCDSQSVKIETFSEEAANQMEKNHVFNVYDEIAFHFSETRYCHCSLF